MIVCPLHKLACLGDLQGIFRRLAKAPNIKSAQLLMLSLRRNCLRRAWRGEFCEAATMVTSKSWALLDIVGFGYKRRKISCKPLRHAQTVCTRAHFIESLISQGLLEALVVFRNFPIYDDIHFSLFFT